MNQNNRNDERTDKPPYSRVFVVCNKQQRMSDLRNAFERFGNIEDMHMPVDRLTGDSKGIAYIKFSKTSSAAAAIQEMHLKTLDGSPKPLKVMVAVQRNDNLNPSEERYKRLFVKIHKGAAESEIKQHFSEFGEVESVHLQRDKATDECRGFAYINYKTFLDAARAFEGCDRKYKPIFATPKDELKRNRNTIENYESFHSSNSSIVKDSYNDYYGTPREHMHPKDNNNFSSLLNAKPQGYTTVSVTCSPPIPHKFVEKFFNILPGMLQCKYTSDRYNGLCKATITYESEKTAAYAVEKLHNYEFPSGEILTVRPDETPLSKAATNLTSIVNSFKNAMENASPDLAQLADAIAQASSLIKAATSNKEIESTPNNFCSVNLPPPQPLADINSKVAQRCFLVFRPHPPPIYALKDAFCRFGDLIDVATFPDKTFGFAKYASVKAAQEAMKTLHKATICGIRLKVIEANEKPIRSDTLDDGSDHNSDPKRMKLEDDEDESD